MYTAVLHLLYSSHTRAKPRAIRLFWGKIPRKRPDAEVFKLNHTWLVV